VHSRIAPALALIVLVAGCQASVPAMAKVTGRVSHLDKPLKSGTITFVHAATGRTATATIGSDGRYELMAEVGRNQIAIDCRGPEIDDPNPKAPKGTKMPGPLLIPYRYTNAPTSELTFDVKPGENTDDIALGR
jgi:hypothetical protein